jgi:hypothetical protein
MAQHADRKGGWIRRFEAEVVAWKNARSLS